MAHFTYHLMQPTAVMKELIPPSLLSGPPRALMLAPMTLKTAGPATRLRLTSDRKVIHADGQDLSFVTVEAVDAEGQVQPNAEQEAAFVIDGPGTISGVATGDTKSPEPYRATRRSLFHGRALNIVRSSGKAGTINLTAQSKALSGASITVHADAGRWSGVAKSIWPRATAKAPENP